MAHDFYVYALVDPRNNLPFYIGKGRGNRPARHFAEARGSMTQWTNALKCRRLLAIERAGLKVLVVYLHQSLSETEAFNIETSIIRQYGRLVDNTGCLTNILTEGNQGPRRYKKVGQYTLTCEFVEQYDSVQEAAAAVGVLPNTIGGALRGRTVGGKRMQTAGGFRWAYPNTPLPVYISPEMLNDRKHKPVTQLTLNGMPVAHWDSAKEAYNSTGIHYTHISAVCTGGRRKSAGGYRWMFTSTSLA